MLDQELLDDFLEALEQAGSPRADSRSVTSSLVGVVGMG